MSEKVKPTVKEVFEKMGSLVGKPQYVPKCKNKGAPGHYAEDKSGIPKSSDRHDCKDGELKTGPIKFNSKGNLVAEESIKVGKINLKNKDLDKEFEDSECHSKLKCVVFSLRFQDAEGYIYFQPPICIDLTHSDYIELLEQLKKDYNAIREFYQKNGTLSGSGGKMCKYLENRTAGPGHEEVPGRAFYLKTQFVNEILIPRLKYTILPSDIKIAK